MKFLELVTPLSLRARVSLALAASVVVGVIALAFGAQHLERLHASGALISAAEFRSDVWRTLTLVVGFANLSGLVVVALTTRTLVSRITRLRDAVRSLADPHPTSQSPVLHQLPAHDEFVPLRDAVLEARVTLHDAMTRVRMESDRNRAIIDTVFAGVFAIDGGGRILSANPAAARMFCQPLASLNGSILSDLIATDSLHLTVDDLGTVTFADTDADRRFTTRIRLYGRPAFPAEVAITPLALDGQNAWAVFVYDLSEKQHADAALDDARRAAATANRAKSAFLARMSHELRTPLNSMIGFTKIVRRSRNSELSDRDRHYLDRVQASSEHLLDLVSDILDLSQLESGRIDLHMAETDLAPIVREIVGRFETQVSDRPLLIEADLPDDAPVATVDVARLRQVLTNLVANAVKFTARGSITVSVTLNHETGLASAIIVNDSGIGIPLERQAHIFESFEEGDEETSNRYGGNGLGLALSWRIAQQMGCMLSVESTPGAGSRFTLAFDRAVVPAVSPSNLQTKDAA